MFLSCLWQYRGMFWNKKNKAKENKKAKSQSRESTGKHERAHKSPAVEDRVCDMTDSQRLRQEALANARKAREQIGEETLNKIAAAMKKKQNSAMERARSELQDKHSDELALEILTMLDED